MTANVYKRKISLRIKRKRRIRAKISGCATCPRVSIFKSNRTVYAQVINDVNSTTLCASDGKVLSLKANKEGAKALAKDLAAKLKDKGIEQVVFDRNGYVYHGVVASFADALRENGIKL
ncbi:50S ribosomal protein L18 [Campylobacter geochelonis]|uniref:Large ribosomal subunit protein uL18 n=1 Tax=Campylobacter geochelonis TaxID=1780362 RepID=A0A128ED58_9BACT|nr:50S ribosomal protein L18 [Campylobacter geochelonis]QKF72196.1 50S ribosomal protein L18 [Campylobacter geochelonis]CZE46093.1 50S ribosomal protein L18 [Campylobacter geochelonis]CZE46536.1 50S ribosomal protein L18 [Campylobacter geochelonis]CZE49717.1 50S ribosomal protein L18 [Campylobacter geochelonis]